MHHAWLGRSAYQFGYDPLGGEGFRMTIADAFKLAVVRRVVYLISLILLGYVGFSWPAHAQSSGCVQMSGPNAYTCATRSEASTFVKGKGAQSCQSMFGSMCESYKRAEHQSFGCDPHCGKYTAVWLVNFGNDGKDERLTNFAVYYSQSCSPGTEWYESLGACDKPCSARNADLGGVSQPIKWANSSASQCIAECKYQIVSDYQTRSISVTSGGKTASAGVLHGGRWEYTGDRCSVTPPKPRDDAKPDTQCTQVSGQSYCIMDDGRSCATASSGRMICWGANENGTKTDGPVTQTKSNGNESPNPPEGSSHTSTTNVTTTTTTNTSNTTINNYTTNSGGPAGSTNNGTGVDGDGKPTGGTGTGSGNGSGTKPGEGEGGECNSSGVNQAICVSKEYLKKISDFFDGVQGEAGTLDTSTGDLQEADSIWGDAPDSTTLNPNLFGGGASCPPAPVYMGISLDPGGNLCMFASIIGALVLVAAYAQAAYIIGRA